MIGTCIVIDHHLVGIDAGANAIKKYQVYSIVYDLTEMIKLSRCLRL